MERNLDWNGIQNGYAQIFAYFTEHIKNIFHAGLGGGELDFRRDGGRVGAA